MTAEIEVARRFCRTAAVVEALGNGHINDTFLVTSSAAETFVLQRINSRVFPQPALIMENLDKLDRHVAGSDNPRIRLKIPKLIQTERGEAFFRDEHGDYWRALEYIADTVSFETLPDDALAGQIGAALGQFHRLINDLNSGLLADTLPGFHIASAYLQHYLDIKSCTDKAGDDACEAFIRQHQTFAGDLETAKMQGILTVRTIHGDPKLNNFLFDKASGKVASLIDLDTVKPGLIHYDIGDCIRSACHDPETNGFNLVRCQYLLVAYLQEMGGALTEGDYRFIFPAIRLIPFELGLRFYTDYLAGNHYFKVSEPDDNLYRARQQFELCCNIIKMEEDIRCIVQSAIESTM